MNQGIRVRAALWSAALVLATAAAQATAQTVEAIPGLAGGIIRTHYVSGNGAKVVFASAGDPAGRNADGNVEIFVYDVATKQTFQLTDTQSQPRFNDNGGALPNYDATRIVFRSRFNLAGAGEELPSRDLFLASVNYAGATPAVSFRRLTTTGENGPYSFSADGRYAAFVSSSNLAGHNSERAVQIFRIALDPAPAIQQITVEPGGIADSMLDVEIDVNGPGDRFAFTTRKNLRGLNPEGNQEIYLAYQSGVISAITSSPSGTTNSQPRLAYQGWVAFRSNGDLVGTNADRNSELFITTETAQTIYQITQTTGGDDGFGGANDQLAINSDGNILAFISNRDLVPGRNADGNRELFVAKVTYSPFAVSFEQLTDTTNPHPGTRIENVYPKMDDQGLRIAFNSDLSPGGAAGMLYLASRPAPAPTGTPRIDALYPATGGPGVPVTLYGRGFAAATAVAFAGQAAASFQIAGDVKILAVAPAGVVAGTVTVTTPTGVASSPSPFQLAQLTVGATEFTQGMAAYQTVAGKDALVRTFVNVSAGAWAVTEARLTITAPSGAVTVVDPRMFGVLIRNTAASHSPFDNVNFFVPGGALAQAGRHRLRVEAFSMGTRVVDQTFFVDAVGTKDVVLAIQSIMRNPDAEEIRLLLDELTEFSRLFPVRAGHGVIRSAGAPAATTGLRTGFIVPPLFSELDGDGAIPTCVALALYQQSCWDEILSRLMDLRSAFNALGDFETIEFVTAVMPRDRIITSVGGVTDCAGRNVDGYGDDEGGKVTWIALCGISTTLSHETGHNVGLVPPGAANSDGTGHSVNSLIAGRNAFNLVRWEHVPDIMSVMCSPACGPSEIVFFEDVHNGRPVDYPFLVNARATSAGAAELPLRLAALADSRRVTDASDAVRPVERWSGRRLMVSVRIDRGGALTVAGVTDLAPGSHLTPAVERSAVELVILDRNGKVLGREYLKTTRGGPLVRPEPGAEQRPFHIVSSVRPLPAGAASIEILHEGRVAYRVRAGTKPPVVTIQDARVVKNGRGTPVKLLLSWNTKGQARSAIHYRVDFSRDGKRYQPFVLRTTRRELAIPLQGLPGGNSVRFRVTASDGLQSTAATTPPLVLPQHAPVVQITSLREGHRLAAGAGIELRGLALDPEDGLLGEGTAPDRSFTWHLDGDTALGSGARLYVAGPLRPGKHVVTLRVADSSGRKGELSRGIVVEAAREPLVPMRPAKPAVGR